MNLVEGLSKEIERVTEVREAYKEIPTGVFAVMSMDAALKEAHEVMGRGDPLEMIPVLKELQGFDY